MASILTPPDTPTGSSLEEERQLSLWNGSAPGTLDLTPHVLIQLEDDLERSRMREAFWISVIVHLMVVLFLVFSPKLFPGIRGVALLTPADLMRDKELTYLDLPPDMQKAPKVVPKPEALSDKNRIAMSRHPSIDKKTLEELKRAGPPGPPAPQAPPGQSAQMSPPAPQGQPAPQQQSQAQQPMPQLQPVPNPKLPAPSPGGGTPNFAQLMKAPGDLTQQAMAAAAARRGTSVSAGGGGDYGAGPGGSARTLGNLEVLSDTQGVDFGPYLSRVLDAVRRNWYTLIPEEARAPLMKRGKLAIEFVILPDGKVAGMKLIAPSGDVSLDRAAWGGITASNPFSPLPNEFHGPYLALRFRFYYNPAKGDLE
jgi:TonB family protein